MGHQKLSSVKQFLRSTLDGEDARSSCLQDVGTMLQECFDRPESDTELTHSAAFSMMESGWLGGNEKDVDAINGLIFRLGIMLSSGVMILIENGPNRITAGVGFSRYIAQGDTVCFILGCRFPLVIRRQEDGDRIVGCCLIGGYGRGQAVKELQAGTRTRETFRFV